jgi:hypothetical protein
MEKRILPPLMECFSEIKDPSRETKNKLYPFRGSLQGRTPHSALAVQGRRPAAGNSEFKSAQKQKRTSSRDRRASYTGFPATQTCLMFFIA